ncbi:MAG: fibronectin type III domain-containing protein [Actinocatenispora sp.]
MGTVLGVGATSQSLNVSDGNIWLWSSKPAQASRINANSGRVDVNQPLLDSRGHHVEVTQNDKYLLLHDLDAGKVTSVDLTRMGFTGSLTVDKGPGVRVALSGRKAVLIDQKSGQVRGFDPATLRTTSARLQLPAPLSGGDFDSGGALWLGVPSQGTVVSVAVSDSAARVTRTEPATDPGHPMTLTVLDHGVLAADPSGTRIAVVTDTVAQRSATAALTDVTAPARTVGRLAVLTLPKTGRVLPVDLRRGGRVHGFDLPDGVTPGPATPFAGRIYVPDAKQHQVFVFSRTGRSLGTLGLSGAHGPLELEVREGHLTINAPDSSVARIVDSDGVTRVVDKYRTDVPGGDGDLSLIAAPAPGGKGKDSGAKPGDGSAQDGPPGPPIPVTALAGSHQVTLSWPAAAANGAPVQHYDISWNGGHRRVDPGDRSLVVGNLHNGRTYSFGVTATNRFGTGPVALSDQVTPGGRTPDVPVGVRAKVARDGTVTVSWKPADEARDYVVQPSGGAAQSVVTGTSATVDGLTGGQSYTFTVVARSSRGTASRPSAPSNAVTPFGVPGQPQNARVQQTGTQEWTVSWAPAADNGGPITGYRVQASGQSPKNVAGSARSAVLTGSGGTFSVVAVNAAGPGEKAIATAQPPPPPTVRITSTDATSKTISVRASASGVNVQNCTLSVPGGGSVTGACDALQVTGTVRASTRYTVSVTSHNAGGDSAPVSATVTTDTVSGRVTCTNDPSQTPNGATYCNTGIGSYASPSQSGGGTKVPNGGTHSVMCQVTGQQINPRTYNNNKVSNVWLLIDNGKYIPYAWFDVNLNNVNTCG